MNAGAGGDTIAADDVGGAKYQRVKLVWGADGSVNDASAAAPIPVVQTGTHNIGTVTTVTTVSAVTAISNALPAGTNNIGDVDVLSLVPGTGATSLGKAIDAVPGASDTGVVALVVRDDALSTLTPADGDYTTARVDSTGALWVRATNGIAGIVDDAAFTPATSEVLPIGFQADETATDSVDEGDIGCPRITLDRKQIVTPYVHAAAGGQSSFRSIDLDETEEEVKGSAGKLFWIHCMNMANAVRYLKVYANTAAGTTVGTTTPIHTFPIPTLATTNGAGFCISFGDAGLSIATGITVAATTGIADADTGAPGANEVVFNCGYV